MFDIVKPTSQSIVHKWIKEAFKTIQIKSILKEMNTPVKETERVFKRWYELKCPEQSVVLSLNIRCFFYLFLLIIISVCLSFFTKGQKKNLEISVIALLCNANSRFIFGIIISRDIELVILGVEFPQINVF